MGPRELAEGFPRTGLQPANSRPTSMSLFALNISCFLVNRVRARVCVRTLVSASPAGSSEFKPCRAQARRWPPGEAPCARTCDHLGGGAGKMPGTETVPGDASGLQRWDPGCVHRGLFRRKFSASKGGSVRTGLAGAGPRGHGCAALGGCVSASVRSAGTVSIDRVGTTATHGWQRTQRTFAPRGPGGASCPHGECSVFSVLGWTCARWVLPSRAGSRWSSQRELSQVLQLWVLQVLPRFHLTRCPFTGLARSSHAVSRRVLPRWAVLCHGLAGSSLRPRWVLPIPGPPRILPLWVLLWPPHGGSCWALPRWVLTHWSSPVPLTGRLRALPGFVWPGPCTLAGAGGSQSPLYKDPNSS